jgi:hypothetical protein
MAALGGAGTACSSSRRATPSVAVDMTAGLGGAWLGARTDEAGREILIFFAGGGAYEQGNPCTLAYDVTATETPTEVVLAFSARRPTARRPPANPAGHACTAEGHLRSVTAHLVAPLGTRALLEGAARRPHVAFDGARLARPGWLPDGWRLQREGASSSGDDTRAWTRKFGPDRPAAAAAACTPSDAGVTVIQAPDPGLQVPADAHEVVHGHPASGRDGEGLTWSEAGWTFTVRSDGACVGDRLASKDEILHVAEGLLVR